MRKFTNQKFITTLDRYIASEFLFSYLVSFLFFFLVFFLNQILLMVQKILAKGIPFGSVLLLLLYSLPSFITLSAPFATMTASLMAYGRFSSDNEILAMRSAGFPRRLIFRPVLVLGIAIALISFGINDILLPAGTQAFQRLWVELTSSYPGLELEPYSIRIFEDTILVSGAIDDDGIHPLVILKNDNSGNRMSLVAHRALSEFKERSSQFPGFRMEDVFTLTPDNRDNNAWSWSNADLLEFRFVSDNSLAFGQSPGPNNMRTADVYATVLEKTVRNNQRIAEHTEKANMLRWRLNLAYAQLLSAELNIKSEYINRVRTLTNDLREHEDDDPYSHSLRIWKLELYQKFAIPLACIPFILLGFPLGLSARRSGRAVGFFIGLLMTSFYWTLLVLGRSLGIQSGVSPFVVMILPSIFLVVIGLILYLRRSNA